MAEPTKNQLKPGLDELVAHEDKEQIENAPKYVVRSAAEICRMNPKPPVEIWGGITLSNDLSEVIGASGIGKSRILLNLAVTQALADTRSDEKDLLFAGYPVHRGELKWLLLGTENGLYRLHYDLMRMTSSCTPEQLDVLGKRLFLSTLEGDCDSYMAVDNPDNVAKMKATIAEVQPDVVVFDPWGDICGGSELDDNVVRGTIAVLRKLRPPEKNAMAIIIVNHSRMGSIENLKATGLDAANFGKNSKVLYTISRCVWNLSFASSDPSEGLVMLTNAKRSNGAPCESHVVRLNSEYMTYEWQDGVNAKDVQNRLVANASTPQQNKAEVRGQRVKDDIALGVEAAKKAVANGPITKTELDTAIMEAGVPSRIVSSVVSTLKSEHGFQSERDSGKHAPTYWGTTEQIEAFRKKKAEKG